MINKRTVSRADAEFQKGVNTILIGMGVFSVAAIAAILVQLVSAW